MVATLSSTRVAAGIDPDHAGGDLRRIAATVDARGGGPARCRPLQWPPLRSPPPSLPVLITVAGWLIFRGAAIEDDGTGGQAHRSLLCGRPAGRPLLVATASIPTPPVGSTRVSGCSGRPGGGPAAAALDDHLDHRVEQPCRSSRRTPRPGRHDPATHSAENPDGLETGLPSGGHPAVSRASRPDRGPDPVVDGCDRRGTPPRTPRRRTLQVSRRSSARRGPAGLESSRSWSRKKRCVEGFARNTGMISWPYRGSIVNTPIRRII